MDIRLVCSDIDGTLLQYGKKELEGEIFDQIRALHQRGIWFCPASGRQYTSLRKLFAPVADCCVFICENGGTIFQEEQCIAKNPMPRALAEEIANSVSHGIGLVFGIVGLVLLLVQAVDLNASATAITSYSLYGGSMILLFLASTLYHAIPHQRAKMWLKKFDHCAIYLLIAGTYTPFLLVGLDSPLARGLMIVIWSLALLGILFKLTIAHRFKILSLVTYLAMGWLSLVVIYEMAVKLAAGSVTLLAVGGVVYSLGVIFYVCKRIPYNHAIWHGFVLGGSVCHFLAIYLYIGQA